MQRFCQRCGQEAATGRFCRQCGAPLFAESEATSAATRNYQSQQPRSAQTAPPNDPYTSPGYPPPDTARLYRTPSMPPYAAPPPKKSNVALWILLGVLCFIAAAGIVSAIVVPRLIARRHAPQFDPNIWIPPARVRPMIPAPAIPPMPPAPPPAPSSSGKSVTSIEDLKYPNATMQGGQVKIFGTEVIKMRTTDDFDSVKKFYEDRLGSPTEEDPDNQTAVFISTNTKKTIVNLKPNDSRSGGILIEIVRVGIPFSNSR